MGLTLAVVLVGLYFYLYQAAPFPGGVNDGVVMAMTVLASALASFLAFLIVRHYGKGTPPRAIWMYFSIALLGWCLGELIWAAEYLRGGQEAAQLSAADFFWVASYFFFIASLYRQYVLIFRPEPRAGLAYLVFSILAVLMFTFLYGIWLLGSAGNGPPLLTYVNAFYAVGDIALSIGALVIVRAFRNGALGRPWYGLLLFSFSDLLYAWLEASGLYAWSVEQGNILTTITDTTYFAAYLLIAFGCYLQVILLIHGPRLKHDH